MSGKIVEPRQFRVNFGAKDSETLKQLSQRLEISETEVIRKGLQLMSLYAKISESEDTALIYRDGDKEQEILVL